MTTTETSAALFVKMVLLQWQIQHTRINDWLAKVSDEQMMRETAPGRNTGIYLFSSWHCIPILILNYARFTLIFK